MCIIIKIIRTRIFILLHAFALQKMLVRTPYYPTSSRKQELLSYLLQKNATSVTTVIEVNLGKILSEMVDAQHKAREVTASLKSRHD